MRSSHIAVYDSCPLLLHVLRWGENGPPCVLIHGFAESANVWSDFAPWLAGRFRILAMDLRGHGDSDWHPEGLYDIDSFVDDLDKLVLTTSDEPVTLIGHSLGAEIAILFAASAPQRVRRLVIVDFGPEIGAAASDQLRAEYASMPRRFGSVADYERWLFERRLLVAPDVLARFASSNLRPIAGGFELKTDPGLVARPQFGQLTNCGNRRSEPRLWDALGKIACPCLVVRGQVSAVLPADIARRMATEVLADGKLAVVNRVGHAVVMGNAAGFFDATRAFLFGADV